MKILYTAFGLSIGILVFMSLGLKQESTVFYGIAETREIVVNFEYPVEIRRICVVEGQVVTRGDTLAVLDRPELAGKIGETANRLNELKAEKAVNRTVVRSNINQLKAKIAELEAQYALNKRLTSELKSLRTDRYAGDAAGQQNPLTIKIESLKRELELAEAREGSTAGRPDAADPVKVQMRQLEEELLILQEQKRALVVRARIDGVVGSVNTKKGEVMSPYAPVLTVHTSAPSYVKGYIHEKIYARIEAGQQVGVRSVADKDSLVTGEVVGVGSRIVEYPVRLRRRQDFQMWGREIVVRIPAGNRFLLGEKVLISPRGNVWRMGRG